MNCNSGNSTVTLEFQTGKQRNELKHNLTTIIESDVRQLFNQKNQRNMLDEKIPKKTFSKCNASVNNMTQQKSSTNQKTVSKLYFTTQLLSP